MNRRLSRGLQVPLFLLLVFALVSCDGCDGGGGNPIPPGPVKNYGPPLYDVIFLSGSDCIATINPVGGTLEYYVEHVGVNQDLSSPGIGVLYKMTAVTSETINLLVYDYSTSTLNILDSQGIVTYSYTDILPELYDASRTRVARVQPKNNGYQLQTSPWGETVSLFAEMGPLVEEPYYYASRPSFNNAATRNLIAIHNSEDHSLDRIAVMGENNYERSTRVVRALAPQYSPLDDDFVAYLDIPDGAESANSIVITDGALDEELARFNFSQFGIGATSFAWSPDGTHIALYAGVFGPAPTLVIIDVENQLISSFDLGSYTIALGSGDDLLYWAFPEWNNDSTELVLPAILDVDETTEYHIVAFNLLESSTRSLSDEGIESTHPHWRKFDY